MYSITTGIGPAVVCVGEDVLRLDLILWIHRIGAHVEIVFAGRESALRYSPGSDQAACALRDDLYAHFITWLKSGART